MLRAIVVRLKNSTLVAANNRFLSVARSVAEMAESDKELRVFVVAGEPSGDSIAARLMSSLRSISPFPVRFAGVGGYMMRNEGLNSLFPMEDLAVMGILELLPHIRKIRRRLQQTVEAAAMFHPHAVVTVDAKGFSFRFLKILKARCCQEKIQLPVNIHYVAPSFWAWKGGEARLKGLSRFVDHLLCILPFEEDVLRENGLEATFVGHPVLEAAIKFNKDTRRASQSTQLKMIGNGASFRQKHGIPSDATVITVLPGSRLQEVNRMLPIYMASLEQLKGSFPALTLVVPVAPNQLVHNYVYRTLPSCTTLQTILLSGEALTDKYDAFHASSAALCTSGTAVLELQLARLPCVVAYRAHLLTEWIIRFRAQQRFISLPNILMNSPVIPEVLFSACKPKELSELLSQLILNDDLRQQQIVSADKVLNLLCPSKENQNFTNSKQLLPPNSDPCPSSIAAYAVLHSKRSCVQNG